MFEEAAEMLMWNFKHQYRARKGKKGKGKKNSKGKGKRTKSNDGYRSYAPAGKTQSTQNRTSGGSSSSRYNPKNLQRTKMRD